jgi:hypothetical protein
MTELEAACRFRLGHLILAIILSLNCVIVYLINYHKSLSLDNLK